MLHYATHDIEKKFKPQPWENIQQPFWATQRKTSLSLQGQCTKLSPSNCPGVSARDGWTASLRHGYWQAWWNNGWSKSNLKTLQINPSNDWSSAFNLVEAIKFKFDQRIRGINVVISRNNNKKARSPGRNWKKLSGIKRKIGSYSKQVVEVQVEETLNSRTRIMLATYYDQFDSYYKVLFFSDCHRPTQEF